MTQALYSNAGFVQPIEIRQGADFQVQIVAFQGVVNGDPFDLTDCVIRALLVKPSTPDDLQYPFTVPDFTATAADGIATLILPNTTTETLVPSPLSKVAQPDYHWYCDIQLPGGQILPYCHGPATVVKGGIQW